MIIKNKYATIVAHKVLGKFHTVVQKWTAPDAPSVDGVLASTLLTSAVQTITSGITSPDFPRVLEIDSDGAASGDVVITGTNIRGEVVTDTITLNGTNAVDGAVAFKAVTSIQLPVKSAFESVFVGWLDKLGLQEIPYSTSVLSEVSGNSDDTGGAVLTRDSDEVEKCLFDPTSETDGSADKMISYLSEDTSAKISAYTQ